MSREEDKEGDAVGTVAQRRNRFPTQHSLGKNQRRTNGGGEAICHVCEAEKGVQVEKTQLRRVQLAHHAVHRLQGTRSAMST